MISTRSGQRLAVDSKVAEELLYHSLFEPREREGEWIIHAESVEPWRSSSYTRGREAAEVVLHAPGVEGWAIVQWGDIRTIPSIAVLANREWKPRLKIEEACPGLEFIGDVGIHRADALQSAIVSGPPVELLDWLSSELKVEVSPPLLITRASSQAGLRQVRKLDEQHSIYRVSSRASLCQVLDLHSWCVDIRIRATFSGEASLDEVCAVLARCGVPDEWPASAWRRHQVELLAATEWALFGFSPNYEASCIAVMARDRGLLERLQAYCLATKDP
ncbi:MAG: hypothetical protein HC843_12080, partial [Sphingomonadales bacterium]|nr:hypothetical protein [Sphingomonadales bacterium]